MQKARSKNSNNINSLTSEFEDESYQIVPDTEMNSDDTPDDLFVVNDCTPESLSGQSISDSGDSVGDDPDYELPLSDKTNRL